MLSGFKAKALGSMGGWGDDIMWDMRGCMNLSRLKLLELILLKVLYSIRCFTPKKLPIIII